MNPDITAPAGGLWMFINYRIYCFDGASRIISAEWLPATNDAEALSYAKHTKDGFRIEVWDRARLVGRHQRREAEARDIGL